ncbi:MAG: hypothetical protein ACRD44_11505, partial [Bryobacteraceae bacterium]
LYAADLAFRLRWQIRPALVEGRTVIAAPYVDSFVALGKAFGVSRRWLVDLFLFAPAPDARFRIDEPEHPPRGQAKGGYVDYAARLLNAGSLIWDPMHVHKRVVDYLEALERRGGCAKPDF